jgi:hypothetical protein
LATVTGIGQDEQRFGPILQYRPEDGLEIVGALNGDRLNRYAQQVRPSLGLLKSGCIPWFAEFHSTVTRESLGKVCLRRSSRLAASCGALSDNPVMFPPG